MTDHERYLDIMRQGFTKRLPGVAPTIRLRIKEIDAALAGKQGFQSEWALNMLREERAALLAR